MWCKGYFLGRLENSVTVFFHGYVYFDEGAAQNYLKQFSSYNTGLIHIVDCLNRAVGFVWAVITIIYSVVDPCDYHCGLSNSLQKDKDPSHQMVNIMTIMLHINATGILGYISLHHGHITTVVV